ncbi:Uncharacterised protein [Moraxella veridica]|uniref:Uncharacterized protein n=2 Tax=Moraxellaceae TaxID=468 RepID=A0A7Z0UY68_MORCA|nr:hypothetical protein AO382_1486 [Moraxella catarrhalis]STY82592.1 Uncharacterised protein [Moraxella catarrhalis]
MIMVLLRSVAISILLSFGLMIGNAAFGAPAKSSTQTGHLPAFIDSAFAVKYALQYQQYDKITPHIHPTKGVRFSLYAYVNPDKDKVFSQAEFDKYLNQSKIQFTWGEKDGTGDLYIVSLPTYLANWVVRDTRFEKVGVNEFYGTGNSLNNLADVYPEHEFVEFYSAGSETCAGMDWRCMRLVFETYQGRPYLVAIITDEWTI